MIITDGSIRSGKTIAMIDGYINWSLSKFNAQNFIMAGKSMGALKRNVLQPMFRILNAKGINYYYNRSENYIVIGDNTYYCFGANNEASQDVLQGLTAAGALGDEAALFPRSFVEQMIGRCSVGDAKVWLNCNPAGPYHYLKTEYIDQAEAKKILHLHFKLDDNLTLDPRTKERYRRMFSGLFYKRYVEGLWVAAEGIIYDMFDFDTMVVDELPAMKRYWIGCDYGTSNATVFLLCGLGVDERLYVIDEYYHSGRSGRQKSPAKYSSDLREFLHKSKVKPEWIFVDPSAEAFIVQLWSDGVNNIAKADNEVKGGIERVASLMSCDAFRVHRRCKNTLRELASYCWDEKAQERGEDKPLKDNDHCMDAMRYVVNSIKRIWHARRLVNNVA